MKINKWPNTQRQKNIWKEKRGDLNIFSSLSSSSISRTKARRTRGGEFQREGRPAWRMKLSSKTMSSPGRTEKFPPPLMRFLRSNVGSRSRGRTRSSPMFVRKKNTAIETTQEPSSPKVTCIGQVRVRRSKQGSGKAAGKAPPRKKTRGCCGWIRNALCCKHFVLRLKPKSFPPVWWKWVSCFRVRFRRKSEIREDSSRIESKLGDGGEDSEESDNIGNGEAEARVLYSSPFSPPRNAFLLTRCRSAPYRSSSLASRFWSSPLASEGEQKTEAENRDPASGNEPSSRDSAAEPRTDPETERDSEYLNQSEDSTSETNTKPTKPKAFKTGEEESPARPTVLTRCKSEPARTGGRLNPDTTLFSKKRRPGFAEPRSSSPCD